MNIVLVLCHIVIFFIISLFFEDGRQDLVDMIYSLLKPEVKFINCIYEVPNYLDRHNFANSIYCSIL